LANSPGGHHAIVIGGRVIGFRSFAVAIDDMASIAKDSRWVDPTAHRPEPCDARITDTFRALAEGGRIVARDNVRITT
jgi:hypothetical protein